MFKLLLTLILITPVKADDINNKVYICHNERTLLISYNALDYHLKHGDYEGHCLFEDVDDYKDNNEKEKSVEPKKQGRIQWIQIF